MFVPTNECNADAYRKPSTFSDWFVADKILPVYTGFYECVYDGDADNKSVMRYWDGENWFMVNEVNGERMPRQACFGWGQDKWRGRLTSRATQDEENSQKWSIS